MKRTTALIATLLALVVVALPSVASAASLNVRSAVLTTVSETGCDDAIEVRPRTGQGVLAQGTTTLFEARGVDKACAGRQLAVTIFRASGAPLGTAVANIPQGFAGGTVNLATGGAVFVPDVAGVAATLGTWGVAATWTLPGDVLPLVICTSSQGVACLTGAGDVRIVTNTAQRLVIDMSRWNWFAESYVITVNLDHPSLALRNSQTVSVTGGGLTDASATSCAGSLLTLRPTSLIYMSVSVTGYPGSGGTVQCY